MTDDPKISPAAGVEELVKANELLVKKLESLQKIERDIAAEEIFEKAKKRFAGWLTAGGIAALLAGALAIKSTQGYVEELATKKIDSIAADKVQQLIQEHAKSRVDALLENEREQLLKFGREQMAALVQQMPVGKLREPLVAANFLATLDPALKYVDLSDSMSPVRDQGQEPSVVGFAVAAALEGAIAQRSGKHVVLSARYIYTNAKKDKMSVGAFIKDAVAFLRAQGAVPEHAWPFIAGQSTSPPPMGLEKAERFRVNFAQEIKTLSDIKAALQNGIPVVTGITVYNSIFAVAQDGIVSDPKSRESLVGKHAICIVGYDDSTRRLKFKNSWSTKWGKAGYGFISYGNFEKNFEDAWAIAP